MYELLLPNLYVDRPEITERIRRSIINNKFTNIYGLPGTGKSTICSFCLDKYFHDTNHIIVDPHRYTEHFNVDWEKPHICILEDFDYMSLNKDILKYINSYSSYEKLIFISRNRINQFKNINAIEIPPFSDNEIYNFLSKRIHYEVKYNKLMSMQKMLETLNTSNKNMLQQTIIQTTNGNPLFVNLIIDQIIKNGTINIDTFKTIYKPCIIDKFGKPIEEIDNSTKIIVTEVNDELLFKLSQNPKLLHGLLPYDFERVIARMFEKKGFTVKMTTQTRDGGKDIFVAKNDLFSFLFYVECKKYAPDKPVGIDVIQRLYGVISAEKVTGGIVATTSHFTKPAKDYIQEHQLEHQLTLQDYDAISDILKSLQHNTQ